MDFFPNLSGEDEEDDIYDYEQSVVVHFNYGQTDLDPLFAVEQQLEKAVAEADVGEYDGNEVATDGSDGCLYMYGPDADALFAVVRPILESIPFMNGAVAHLYYGPPEDDVPEAEIIIGS